MACQALDNQGCFDACKTAVQKLNLPHRWGQSAVKPSILWPNFTDTSTLHNFHTGSSTELRQPARVHHPSCVSSILESPGPFTHQSAQRHSQRHYNTGHFSPLISYPWLKAVWVGTQTLFQCYVATIYSYVYIDREVEAWQIYACVHFFPWGSTHSVSMAHQKSVTFYTVLAISPADLTAITASSRSNIPSALTGCSQREVELDLSITHFIWLEWFAHNST